MSENHQGRILRAAGEALLAAAAMIGAGLTLGSCGPSAEPPAEIPEGRRPNFVFILADDLGWRDLSYSGNDFHETPHIDSLANRGTRFEQFYAASPTCSPTRASIVTGKYPARLWLTRLITPNMPDADELANPTLSFIAPHARDRLPAAETTIAERLSEYGYATALIGKWHLGPADDSPTRHGFQHYRGSVHSSGISYFPPYGASDLADGPAGEYLTDRLTDEAIEFIRANRERPFFLHLPHYAVHAPYEARPELTEYYREKAGNERRYSDSNPVYAAMVHSLDESVGRIVAELEKLELAQHTVLIFTSDNGGSHSSRTEESITSNLPLRGGKGELFEGGIRVPTLILWPRVGVGGGGDPIETPAISVDFYPTILELARVPPEPENAIDGVSLVPLLKGDNSLGREAIYFHHPHVGLSAIRAGDMKLIRSVADGNALYDLAADPGETRDLASESRRTAGQLESRLLGWLDGVGAQIPAPNPSYLPPGPGGWIAGSTVGLRQLDQSLLLLPLGPVPKLVSPLLGTQQPVVARLRLRSASATTMKIRRAGDRGTELSLPGDKRWHQYRARVSTAPRFNRLHLEISSLGGPVAIDWIRLYVGSSGEGESLEAFAEWDFGAGPTSDPRPVPGADSETLADPD